jgi:hypothetical protein
MLVKVCSDWDERTGGSVHVKHRWLQVAFSVSDSHVKKTCVIP